LPKTGWLKLTGTTVERGCLEDSGVKRHREPDAFSRRAGIVSISGKKDDLD
jgi:hypothetical protein